MIKIFTTPQREKQEKIKRPIAWALNNSIIFIKSNQGLLVPLIMTSVHISWLKEVDRDMA
jgi:hypothetical protein